MVIQSLAAELYTLTIISVSMQASASEIETLRTALVLMNSVTMHITHKILSIQSELMIITGISYNVQMLSMSVINVVDGSIEVADPEISSPDVGAVISAEELAP